MTTIHAGDRTTGCDECATNDYMTEIQEAGYEAEAVKAYADYIYDRNLCNWQDWIDEFEEAYAGDYISDRDFAEDLADQTGILFELPQNLRYYFDFEAFARDLLMGDYWSVNTYYFRSI